MLLISGGTCGIQLEWVQTSEMNFCGVVGYFVVKSTHQPMDKYRTGLLPLSPEFKGMEVTVPRCKVTTVPMLILNCKLSPVQLPFFFFMMKKMFGCPLLRLSTVSDLLL